MTDSLSRVAMRAKHRAKLALRPPESLAAKRGRLFREFRAAAISDGRFVVDEANVMFVDGDDTANSGFDRHYVYHVAWAARVLAATQPARHVDIGSLLEFSAMLSATIPTHFYDFRPPDYQLDGLATAEADLTNLQFPDDSMGSLSCMHVVEHIGLGRYGDPLSPTADVVAMRELARVLAPGGNLLFVVPVGRPRVCFNAHRVYAYEMVLDGFPDLDLVEFALIPDIASDGHL
jgi:hypothetical protein